MLRFCGIGTMRLEPTWHTITKRQRPKSPCGWIYGIFDTETDGIVYPASRSLLHKVITPEPIRIALAA
jgi:hypothetical protein